MEKFKDILKSDVAIIENRLKNIFPSDTVYQKNLIDSMEYSINAGGKRLRPVLFLETLKLFEKKIEDFLDIACSIEIIHTYSLIHDDLPAMDDDTLRRGKPTNHVVFGEGTAILAGDGLLNYAYELMHQFLISDLSINNAEAIYHISKAAGIMGMIGGQSVDIESENKEIDISTMDYIHKNKTGALINASIMSAAKICNANHSQLKALSSYADSIGLTFQITDDILDIEGDQVELGKNIGSDVQNSKATYPKFYGIEKSREMALELTDTAIKNLEMFPENKTEFFKELAYYIIKRKK